ncbi:MAG: glycosyltransferase family 4 protein [Firmicutes bacterium]|nr:glycosyltransferase family 4 protein [Bacillota bacterium]
MNTRKKIAILTNIVAPYRLPIYKILAQDFDVSVFFSGWEDNRDFWQQEQLQVKGVWFKKAWGFIFKIPQRRRGVLFDYWYLHINPGYLWDLCTNRPDAVISNEMGFRTLMSLTYGSMFRRPVWVCWEGTLHTEKNIGVFKRLIRSLIARWAKRWISFGKTSTEYLLHLNISPKRILQVQNCVEEKVFTAEAITPAFNIRPEPVFLYAGQLINRKGIKYLMDAVARVQAEGYKFSLLLVGGGFERAYLEKYALELNIKNIFFHPPVKSTYMAQVYNSADVFIFPTLHDVWGLVVNEALWSGLPVLASKYAGCAQELLPPQNIFDPLDQEDFKAVLRLALNGKIAAPDYKKLKTIKDVSQLIANNVKGALRGYENLSGS